MKTTSTHHIPAGFVALCFLITNTNLSAQDTSTANGPQFFREKVHPILKEHCFKCHGGEKIKGDLVLTNRNGLLKGGEQGKTIDIDVLDLFQFKDGVLVEHWALLDNLGMLRQLDALVQ